MPSSSFSESPREITPVVPIKPLSRRRFFAALAGGGGLALLGGLTLKDAWPLLVSQWNTQPLGVKRSHYAAWTRDLSRLALTSEDDLSTTLLWDYTAQRVIGTLHSSVSGLFPALDWSPDGRRILQVAGASSQDNAVCWDIVTQKTVYTVNNQHISDVWQLGWSPDGRHAAVIGNTTCVVLNSDNGQERFVQQLSAGDAPIAFAWSSAGDRLALLLGNTTSNAITLLIWDAAANTVVARLEQANMYYNSYNSAAALAWVPGKNELVIAINKTLWLVPADNTAMLLGRFTDYLNSYTLNFASDGQSLAVADQGKLAIWNVHERRQERVIFRGESPSFIQAVSWLNASQIAILDDSYNRIVLTR